MSSIELVVCAAAVAGVPEAFTPICPPGASAPSAVGATALPSLAPAASPPPPIALAALSPAGVIVCSPASSHARLVAIVCSAALDCAGAPADGASVLPTGPDGRAVLSPLPGPRCARDDSTVD